MTATTDRPPAEVVADIIARHRGARPYPAEALETVRAIIAEAGKSVAGVINNKGGVGKSLIVALIAAALARRGFRVLVIDFDGQGNLTRRMGYTEAEIKARPSIAEAIKEESPEKLRKCLIPCQWDEEWAENITIAPADTRLDTITGQASEPGSALRLRLVLEPVAGEWDFVLIDTPPSLGHNVHNALAASQQVYAVTEPETDSIRGAMRVRDTMNDRKMQLGLNLQCELAGVIINNHRANVADEIEQVRRLRALFGEAVVGDPIPLRAPIAATVERELSPFAAADKGVRDLVEAAAEAIADRMMERAAA